MRCVSRTSRTSRATGRGSMARGSRRARRHASRPAERHGPDPERSCFARRCLARSPSPPCRPRAIVRVGCSQRALRDDDSIELQADEAGKQSSITFRFVAPARAAADPLTSTRRKS
eukprot:5934301-Prymnesium_polylepis.1